MEKKENIKKKIFTTCKSFQLILEKKRNIFENFVFNVNTTEAFMCIENYHSIKLE